MLKQVGYSIRLMRAGWVIGRTGLFSHMGLVPKPIDFVLSVGRKKKYSPSQSNAKKTTTSPSPPTYCSMNKHDSMNKLARALEKLGPSYVKLGQFLATRVDIIGPDIAQQLVVLQDKMPAFSMTKARGEVAHALRGDIDSLFTQFESPIAAASIAQVHKARIKWKGEERDVAVKILRPDIERRFARDMDCFRFAARMGEKFYPASRRLRPGAAVETLAQSAALEMDLRMEGAALSEIAQNSVHDKGFRVPHIYWSHTARRVLTTEWIDATALSDVEEVRRQGHDMEALARRVIQVFLRHALRDGFFHADMHQGNLFVNEEGTLIAVDCGIMGRLEKHDRNALADVLYHFLKRDYQRVSDVHFEIGWTPKNQDPTIFAQALRSIGETLMQKPTAEELSMGGLLEQLFHITAQFGMETQPQLLLLQKTMVVVEGVARNLYPQMNMWAAAEPILREWMENRIGFKGKIQDSLDMVSKSGGRLIQLFETMPDILEQMGKDLHHIAKQHTDKNPSEISDMPYRKKSFNITSFLNLCALWLGAVSLGVIAYFLIVG